MIFIRIRGLVLVSILSSFSRALNSVARLFARISVAEKSGASPIVLPFSRFGGSCKVDIACDSLFPGVPQKRQQIPAFGLTAAASNEDNQPGIRMVRDQLQKIIPVAGHDKKPAFVGVAENIQVTSRYRQHIAQFRRFVKLTTQYPRHFRGNIVIEEKPHGFSGPLIWRATNVSISARWSS